MVNFDTYTPALFTGKGYQFWEYFQNYFESFDSVPEMLFYIL